MSSIEESDSNYSEVKVLRHNPESVRTLHKAKSKTSLQLNFQKLKQTQQTDYEAKPPKIIASLEFSDRDSANSKSKKKKKKRKIKKRKVANTQQDNSEVLPPENMS